jgi:hypothetical protein
MENKMDEVKKWKGKIKEALEQAKSGKKAVAEKSMVMMWSKDSAFREAFNELYPENILAGNPEPVVNGERVRLLTADAGEDSWSQRLEFDRQEALEQFQTFLELDGTLAAWFEFKAEQNAKLEEQQRESTRVSRWWYAEDKLNKALKPKDDHSPYYQLEPEQLDCHVQVNGSWLGVYGFEAEVVKLKERAELEEITMEDSLDDSDTWSEDAQDDYEDDYNELDEAAKVTDWSVEADKTYQELLEAEKALDKDTAHYDKL